MEKIKEMLKDNKVLTIICVLILGGMLLLTGFEIIGTTFEDKTETSANSSTFSQLDYYLSKINGVGEAISYISYDSAGNPMGVMVLCQNLNKDTELKIKSAVHVITGVPLSGICIYETSNK